jgi:hypothetical protein
VHTRFAIKLLKTQDIPDDPWASRKLDQVDVPANRVAFCNMVHLTVVAFLLKHILTSTGFSKFIQRGKVQITFTCQSTGKKKIDDPCLLYLLFDWANTSLVVSMELL